MTLCKLSLYLDLMYIHTQLGHENKGLQEMKALKRRLDLHHHCPFYLWQAIQDIHPWVNSSILLNVQLLTIINCASLMFCKVQENGLNFQKMKPLAGHTVFYLMIPECKLKLIICQCPIYMMRPKMLLVCIICTCPISSNGMVLQNLMHTTHCQTSYLNVS